jgi:hypothetical protein
MEHQIAPQNIIKEVCSEVSIVYQRYKIRKHKKIKNKKMYLTPYF